ncbi:17732_t:CDS:2, partial [Racocetra persica]
MNEIVNPKCLPTEQEKDTEKADEDDSTVEVRVEKPDAFLLALNA